MPYTASNKSRPAPRDDGTAGVLVWFVLYAAFIVALFALQGGTGAIPIR